MSSCCCSSSVFSVPSPQPLLFQPTKQTQSRLSASSLKFLNNRPPLFLLCSSSLRTPTPSATEEEEEEQRSSSSPSSLVQDVPRSNPESASDNQQFSGCKTCGREEIEKGCDGEGRIQGGIATIPGFGWWPIKAFRPCPGFVASGRRYTRRGQSMDEVAFGRGGRDNSVGSPDITETSKKKGSTKRLKS